MSKIANDGLTRSGTGCFIPVVPYPCGNSGHHRVNVLLVDLNSWPCLVC